MTLKIPKKFQNSSKKVPRRVPKKFQNSSKKVPLRPTMSAGMVWTRLHGAMSGNHWKCPEHQRTFPNGIRLQTRTLYRPDFKLSAQPGPCLFPSRLVCVGEGLRRLDCARRIRNWRSRPTSHRAGRQQSKLHPRAPFFHLPFPPPPLHVSSITYAAKPC